MCRSIADDAQLVDAVTISATTNDMCYPASESLPCCHLYMETDNGHQELFCYTAADVITLNPNAQCGTDIHVTRSEDNVDVDYVVNCFPPAQPADDSGLSTGAVAGISVGAVAFVGLIAAAAVCL